MCEKTYMLCNINVNFEITVDLGGFMVYRTFRSSGSLHSLNKKS